MAIEFDAYRERPIPLLEAVREVKKGYRAWPIDSTEPSYKENCIDARTRGIAGSNFYHHSDNPPYYQSIPGSLEEFYLRTTVIERLIAVNEGLRSVNLELFLYDAWRPAAVQHYFHDEWFPANVREKNPQWSEERIADEVNTYWAFGPAQEENIDPLSPPPHSTGGAFDLTLRHLNGDMLWMGTMFDDGNNRSYTDALELPDNVASLLDEEARMNRRILYWSMRDAGFVNNPTEWWHFSYGDQMWAKLTSIETGTNLPATYSNIDPRS